MIATGVPSRPRNPSGPPSPSSWRKATPTTTVGSTNGTSSAARTAAPTRQREPVQDVRRRQAEHDGQQRRGPRGPHREPRDPVHPRPGEHLEHRTRREAAVDEEALRDHAGHRQHEEDADDQRRAPAASRREGQPATRCIRRSPAR